jgi:ABC-type lipoprotein release transport system permease subunit
MGEAIIVAILSLIGTLIGTLGGILAANKLTNYRIEQLEKKVEEHNNLVSRMYTLEKQVAIDEEEIEHLKKYHN